MCQDTECVHSYRINDVWTYLDVVLHFKRSDGPLNPICPYKIDWTYKDEATGEVFTKKTLFRDSDGDLNIEEIRVEDKTPYEAQQSFIGSGEMSELIEPIDIH